MGKYTGIVFPIFILLTSIPLPEELAMDEIYTCTLTPEEERIILQKGTEAPYSGKYDNFFKKGSYHCKQCNAILFSSDDKIASGCGWPSFDDEIPGAVKRQKDADGKRTEILCAKCGGHLGHVFEGEGLTAKNVRHCVNSLSLVFIPAKKELHTARAYFAGGCFWGVEHLMQHKDGVISAVSGYMGGSLPDPAYQDVTSGNTGHFETVKVTYDTTKIDYETLAKFFFEIHDPTQVNGQGPDIGHQYESAIFFQTNNEKKTAYTLIDKLKNKGHKVATRVIPAGKFWKAEEYHQDYYDKKKQQPYCHMYKKKF